MSHDSKYNSTMRKWGAPCRKWLLAALLMLAPPLLVSATAFAKGSDAVAPFPIIDSLSGDQYASASTIDGNGNIIVVGSSNPGSGSDYHVRKFQADGSGRCGRFGRQYSRDRIYPDRIELRYSHDQV